MIWAVIVEGGPGRTGPRSAAKKAKSADKSAQI